MNLKLLALFCLVLVAVVRSEPSAAADSDDYTAESVMKSDDKAADAAEAAADGEAEKSPVVVIEDVPQPDSVEEKAAENENKNEVDEPIKTAAVVEKKADDEPVVEQAQVEEKIDNSEPAQVPENKKNAVDVDYDEDGGIKIAAPADAVKAKVDDVKVEETPEVKEDAKEIKIEEAKETQSSQEVLNYFSFFERKERKLENFLRARWKMGVSRSRSFV